MNETMNMNVQVSLPIAIITNVSGINYHDQKLNELEVNNSTFDHPYCLSIRSDGENDGLGVEWKEFFQKGITCNYYYLICDTCIMYDKVTISTMCLRQEKYDDYPFRERDDSRFNLNKDTSVLYRHPRTVSSWKSFS